MQEDFNGNIDATGAYNTAKTGQEKQAVIDAYYNGNYGMAKGGMIKRADGSSSHRGLWDNIRAKKGSGKKPTAAMLKQEKKIKAEEKK